MANPVPDQSDRATLVEAFARLTAGERQLLVCALAGNHPPRLAPLRMEVLRGLAKADRLTPDEEDAKT